MNVISNGKHSSSSTYSARVRSSKEAIWTEPQPIEKLNWLIYLQFSRGEINTCQELIKTEISKSYGRNEYAFYTKGVIAQSEGRVQEALENFQTCYKLNNGNVEYIKKIAKCLFTLRRYRLSLEAALEAEKIAEKPDWEICHHLDVVKQYAHHGKKKVCHLNSNDNFTRSWKDILSPLGECLVRLEDVPKAKEYARRAVQLGKQETSYALLVKILSNDDDIRAAISVCNAALEYCPDSVDMLTECGLLHLRIGQTQQAFERLSSALALDPTLPKALLGVGCITQSHDEFDVALSKYKVALQNAPDSVSLWNNIGMCFFGKQKYVAAISCLKRALWLSPLNSRVLFNLGLVYLSTQQAASAFNFLSAAVNIRPDYGQSFMLLACSLLELKDPENALLAAKRGFSLATDDPNVALNMAVCLVHNKVWSNALDAIVHFRTLAERNPYVSQELLEFSAALNAIVQKEAGQADEKGSAFKPQDNKDTDAPRRELDPDEV